MRSFVDQQKTFRWVNRTPWSTEDMQQMVNTIYDEARKVGMGDNRRNNFRNGIKTITIQETVASMKYRTATSTWSNPTIQIKKRALWYESEVEALAAASAAADSDAAPKDFVEELADSMAHCIIPAALGFTLDQRSKINRHVADTVTLRPKRNKLEEGEEDINSSLRFRSYRQSRIAARRAWQARQYLFKLKSRVRNFERNGVGLEMTEHEHWILQQAYDLMLDMYNRLTDKSQEHLRVLTEIE
jgi:hypothetical protein